MYTPEDVLWSYYKETHKVHLDLDLPNTLLLAKQFASLTEWTRSLPGNQLNRVQSAIQEYKVGSAAPSKLSPLRSYLRVNSSGRNVGSILEIGFGEGHSIPYLLDLSKTVKTFIGIDPGTGYPSIPMKFDSHQVEFRFFPGFGPLSESGIEIDLVVIIHSLHHMEKMSIEESLEFLKARIARRGLIFIYEDSWADEKNSNTVFHKDMKDYDKKFLSFSQSDKRKLFQKNDYWANNWCYERGLGIPNPTSYKSVGEWEQFLASYGFRIIAKGGMGFDPYRLHGVPSAWLIASLSED